LSTLILGIGNTLLQDEGVGVYVMEYLRSRHGQRAGLRFLDGGTLSFTLAGDIAQADALIVSDAARLGAPPGTVRTFQGREMDRYLRGARNSVHEVGLADLFDMARLSDSLPPQRALVGIEPAALDWGDRPSAVVAAAIPRAAANVLEILRDWGRGNIS